MNKFKRVLFTFFIFAYILAQFESIKAESVKAEYTDAANTEVIAEVVARDKEPIDIDMSSGVVTAPFTSDEAIIAAREELLPQTIIKENAFEETAPILSLKKQPLYYKEENRLNTIC